MIKKITATYSSFKNKGKLLIAWKKNNIRKFAIKNIRKCLIRKEKSLTKRRWKKGRLNIFEKLK